MTQYKVKDGVRTYKFFGDLLASSSSESADKDRWVEFELYKTDGREVYIVSRIGHSRVYHSADCDVVSRNRLSGVDPLDLNDKRYEPCKLCKPTFMDTRGVFPEVPRYHAQVCDTAEQVIDHLKKKDENSYVYLTKVARVLLEDASKLDEDIRDAYFMEEIQ